MAIVGLNGQPLKSKKEEDAGKVYCDVLFQNLEAVKLCKGVTMPTPKGPALLSVDQALTGVLFSLFGIMLEAGQKELVLSIKDTSSDLVMDKQLMVRLGTLPGSDEVGDVENGDS